ncbi:Zinc finger protein 638 [Collichthys lucidus]|uniref:Zinc finger protein 638 n=1 Tax=Collichthys lucidus TaxID=240159 RepID=A0A4U5VW97_COLLU|nr:Zinc finger protein 638 [Collichthys lucidus]
MLEEKKPRGSLQQGSEDAGQPKTLKINTGARNSATGKTDRISKSNNNIKPAHRLGKKTNRKSLSFCFLRFKSTQEEEWRLDNIREDEFEQTKSAGHAQITEGPLPSPLLGGLPGSSLLIAQQAASLRLAQLKAQLALTQINNALAVGSQAATFTANCNTPAPYISTKPPSPTAAAINLLNVLKIANTMSHPMYNPYASGNQSSTQGQYGHPSMQAERDQRRSSCLGPGSNFGSTGGSSLIPDTSGGIPSSSLSSQSMNYRPEQGRAIMDKELERSIDMHISRAREEVRVLGKPVHHPLDQDTRFTNTQRHEFHSPGTGMVSYPSLSSTSAAPGHRHSDIESGGTSLDWSSNYKRPTADDSKFYSSSVSSNNASGRDDRFFPPIERPRDMQSIPGLGDYDRPVPESTRPKYTSESAASILMHFGLQKEDLEELLSYPEDQITPANLPYILRQIRIQKTKRTPTTVQTKSYPESVSERGSHSLNSSGSSSVLQPSKVIEYGHTGKYTGGVVDDTGKTSVSRANSGGSGGILRMDSFSSSQHTREPPQKNTTVVKSSALGSSQQASSVTSLSSSYNPVLNSAAPPSHDQTKQLQTSQANLGSFVLPKKDTDLRVLKAEVSKPVPVKEPEADRQSTSKTQPPCTPLFRGVHPGRPGLVLIGRNNNSGTKSQTKTQANPVPPTPLLSNITDASRPMQRMMFLPDDPRSRVIPPLLPQTIQNFNHMTLPPSSRQPPAKVAVTKGLPTLAMMHDYAAASPRIFPHTCSLCNKECTHMKNTNLHLESCRLLRNRYPDWDGEILQPRAAAKDAKPQAVSSAQTSQQRHQKTSRGSHSHSRSRSPSPRRHRGSEGRRERRSSPSRSPHNSRYTFRSRSRSPSPRHDHPTSSRFRPRSRSPERRLSPKKREERWSSPRRDNDRRSSPRRNDGRRSPRRSDERRSPPRRSHERRSSAEAPSPQRKKSSSAEKLAKKLLGTSAVQSLSKQTDLDTVVKTLAPVLLAELVKMKSTSSSSSSASSKGGKPSSSTTPAGGKRPSSTGSSSSTSSTAKKKVLLTKSSKAKPSLQKSEASSSTKTKSGKSSPPTMVRLEGIRSSLSHKDVIAAMEQFGKTKSVLLFRSKLEAIVCFEKEEDAKKLRGVKSLDVKGLPVNVIREKETDSKDQKKPPRSKPVSSSASGPQTISATKTTTSRKVLLPTPSMPPNKRPLLSGAQKATKAKLTNKKIAPKGLVKGLITVTKAKVLVSKAKNISTKQIAKIVKTGKLPAKGPVKKAAVKQKTSSGSKARASENQPKAGGSKQKPILKTSETSVKESLVVLKETDKIDKLKNVTVAEPTKGKDTVTKEKVMASKAEMDSTAQKPKTSVDKLATAGAAAKEKVDETAAKAGGAPSKSTTSETRPDVETSKPKESETKVKEAVVVPPKDTAKVVKRANVTEIEPKHQTKLDKANRAEDDEQMQLGETVSKVAEPMEVGSSTDEKGKQLTSENSDKSSDSQPPTSTVQTPPTESSVSSLTHVQQSTLSEPVPTKCKLVSEPSETSVKGSAMMLKELDAVVKPPTKTVTEPTKIKEVVGKAKVMVSKVDTASKMQKPKTSGDKLPLAGAVAKEKVEETAAKAVSAPSKSTTSENFKPEESETKVQEAVVVPKDTANVTGIEPKHQAKLDEANRAEDFEPMQLGETGVAEAIEVGSCADDRGQKLTESSAPSDSQPPTSTVQSLPTESSVKSLTQVQKSTPEPTAQECIPESSETSVKESAMMLKKTDKVDKSPNQTGSEPTRDKEIVSKAGMASTTQKSATSAGADPAGRGKAKACVTPKILFSPRFAQIGQKKMLITLPKHFSDSYTEDELAGLFIPFGFEYTDENIYVIPQAHMAIIQMPTIWHVQELIRIAMKGFFFKGVPLSIRVLASRFLMTPFEFYKRIMNMMKMSMCDSWRTVFIKNISVTEARDLRESVRKMKVRNYLPLLNKVFVEFETFQDTDQLGVWYSRLKRPPGYEIQRLGMPQDKHPELYFGAPHLVHNAVPDSEESGPGVFVPMRFDLPQGTGGAFWVTMRSRPFMYPTISVWFNVPDHLTARGKEDIEKARSILGSMSPTIMLTGLPMGDYKHEDLAKLVWRYFPKQNLHSLYYNMTVLPLQRRAFVHFPDWTSCRKFLRDPRTESYYIKKRRLTSHFVLDYMRQESSEEMKYKSLMKLSNAGVPEEESLEERLLCVEISETSVDVIELVMEVVATLATFVNFLPLGNRVQEHKHVYFLHLSVGRTTTYYFALICVEMAEPSGVKQVVEKYKTVPQKPNRQSTCLKSLKQRLQDSSEITIHFEPDTVNFKAKTPSHPPTQPPTVKSQTQPLPPECSDNGSQPAQQASGPGGSTPSKPITAGTSETAASDVAMDEDVEKSGTETAIDSTVGSRANEDVKKALTTLNSAAADVTSTSVVSGGNTAPSATGLTPEENLAELPQIDTDIFKALKAAVHQYRLTRESKPQSEDEVQDDFANDRISFKAYLSDEQSFNMDDFVTVDEIGEDVEDASLEPESLEPESLSASKQSSRTREGHGSGRSSEGKLASTRSSTDSKRSASSSSCSSSSKSTKGSSSASPKESKTSSEPTSTASVSRSSTYAPPLSTGIPSSPGQKTEQTTSSGRSTRSSSAAREREKITSAATVKASMQTPPKPLREEAGVTESAVTVSDHKASAETKLETSSEEQGVELSQGQSLEIVNVDTLKDQKKSKEEGKKDDDDKHIEDDDNMENYQILDSVDDQTDEQIDDGNEDDSSKIQQTRPEKGPTVGDEGKARPEEDSEMEINSPFQVLDSVTEDQAAMSQEDSHLVQDDDSTLKQLSEEGATPAVDRSESKDAVGKDQETNDKDFQVSDTCSVQALGGNGDGENKRHKEEEEVKLVSAESCKASKDVETPDDQIVKEDQPVQDNDNKDHDSDVTEQETFEILDSIDDQTATEDDGPKHETDETSQEEVSPREEDQDSYQVIDSLEDQPTTTEPESETDKKGKRTKRGEATATKDHRPSRRSGPATRASKSEETEKSPKKEDRTVKKHETRTKKDTTAGVREITEAPEEMMYEIVDSVEDEPVQETATTERSGRRKSTRGKKEEKITLESTEVSEKPVEDEEATYKILDSVEEETADDEPIATRRSTRGKTSKDTPARTRQTPARESQERNRETAKKGERAPSRHSTPTKSDVVVGERSEEVTCEMYEDKATDDQPTTGAKRKRGRPKKEVKIKKDIVTLKKEDKGASEKAAEEEEATYQILDSVEDKTTDGPPPSGQSRKNATSLMVPSKNEEEEPMYEIIDSLEDDQEEPNTTEVSDGGRKKTSDETPAKEEPSTDKGDTPTCGTTSLYETVDDLEEARDDPSAAKDSAVGNEERTSNTDIKKEDKSTTKSRRGTATPEEEKKEKSPEKNNPVSTLDEVSEEEEDYPDDTAEEEELRKRQAATKEKQFAKERKARRTTEREKRRPRDKEKREQMSRSRSSSSGGGGDRGGTRRTKERGRENDDEEEEEVDSKELVTLDEVGADEGGEEREPESREWDEEITEGELQALVTLDEFVEEEDDKKTPETRPLLQEDESEPDSLNPETLVTLDEAGDEKDEEPDEERAEKTSRSAKRKHDGDTEETMNFVTIDEVGEVEEEEEKEAVTVTTRTRGRAKKRSRQTPVRKSARGKKVSTDEEKEAADVPPPTSLDASSSSDKDPSTSLSGGQQDVQRTEVEAASQTHDEASSAGHELQPERPENQTVEERLSRADIKVVSKQRSELVGPEPKRSRSQSPCVAADFKMPTFKPNNPLGVRRPQIGVFL